MDQFPTPQNAEKTVKASRAEQFIGYVIERICERVIKLHTKSRCNPLSW